MTPIDLKLWRKYNLTLIKYGKSENMNQPQCRLCLNEKIDKNFFLTTITNPLPEYIWPIEKKEVVELSSCNVYQCLKCNHLQLQKFTDDEIVKFYIHGSFIEDNFESKKIRLNEILGELGPNFFKHKKVLDVGGGNNPFVKLLSPYTQDLAISDFSVTDEAKKVCAGNIFYGLFEESSIPENTYDVILSFHSMEHMYEPAKVVAKMKKLLKKDGVVIVEVPNFPKVVEKTPYYSIFHQHMSMFTRSTLTYLFTRQGFKLKKILQEETVLHMIFENSQEKNQETGVDLSSKAISLLQKKMAYLNNTLTTIIQKCESTKLAVYGAGGSSSLLIHNVPVIKENIQFCFDRDVLKQNKYIPGTRVQILPPEEIKKSDFIIFLTSQLKTIFETTLTCPSISIEEILSQHEINL
jgi:C-methyltransferase